ncbi:hypothetical protein [Thioalkalivibrio sp. ALE16]|uniref:hypothetical protein n=1 Tax=Thioalkalivibrio sp. ALE16 TaxID=1158172 RepID=UPI000373D644|nr:hypothetical protein [Thioalkalivibrio sp. ALE16]
MVEILLATGTLLTAMAALGTSIATFKTLRETRLSREVSTNPKLFPLDSQGSVHIQQTKPQLQHTVDFEGIRLENFGRGPLLNLELRWSIDVKELVEFLREVDQRKIYNVHIHEGQDENWNELRLSWNHFYARQLEERVQIIAPRGTEEPVYVRPPAFFMEAFVVYLHVLIHERDDRKKYVPIPNFVPAELTVRYSSLAEDTFSQRYEVELEYEHNQTLFADEEGRYYFRLHVKHKHNKSLNMDRLFPRAPKPTG